MKFPRIQGADIVIIDADSLDTPMGASGVPAMKKAGFAILEILKQDFTYEHKDLGKSLCADDYHNAYKLHQAADGAFQIAGTDHALNILMS